VTIRVVVADDQGLVRSGFAMLLGGEPDIEVVGEAANGAEAVALVASARPDVVLMDVRMPVMDGLEATRRITEDASLADTRVVILTTFDLDEYVHEALRAGASGFLLKDTLPVDLLHAVRVVAAGDALIAPKITRRLIEEFARRPEPAGGAAALAALDVLTEREREVLEVVAKGHSNAEIAEALFVSHATVKTHISRLLMKLAVRDRAQLVMIAYETGLVAPGSAPGSVLAPPPGGPASG
jgi:DNA-binding NarL/FixJ family response regulator